MAVVLKPGTRMQSVTCSTQAVVVKAPATEVDLRCGGQPMVAVGEGEVAGTPAPGFDGGTQVGKRYVGDGLGVEVLCTAGGDGSISVGEQVLEVAGAKPLPASD